MIKLVRGSFRIGLKVHPYQKSFFGRGTLLRLIFLCLDTESLLITKFCTYSGSSVHEQRISFLVQSFSTDARSMLSFGSSQ